MDNNGLNYDCGNEETKQENIAAEIQPAGVAAQEEQTTPQETVSEEPAVSQALAAAEAPREVSAAAEQLTGSADQVTARSGKEKKPKKRHGFFFRAARGAACAVLIGALAGASFYGAVYAGRINFPIKEEDKDAEVSEEVLAAIDAAVEQAVRENQEVNGSAAITSVSTVGGQLQVTVMDVSDIVKNVITSVVAINGTTNVSYDSFGFGLWGGYFQDYEVPCSGSGIIIGTNDTELLVVTNAHVVQDVNNLQVSFCNGTSVNGVIKGIKTDSDLAVVAVSLEDIDKDTMSAISIAKLGTSDDIEVGEAAIAIGNAAGYGISVTAGIVSAVDRSLTVENAVYNNLIQTDAAINPGNSGGALFNAKGEVIGINSVKMSSTDVEGMGYAISIESVKDIIGDLSTQTTRTALDDDERGYLGVAGNTVTSSISSTYGWPVGVLVKTVSEGSAAEAAGIEVNDVITSFDGRTIDSWDTLVNTMQYYEVGETVEVKYYHLERGSFVEKTVQVTLTEKPEQSR